MGRWRYSDDTGEDQGSESSHGEKPDALLEQAFASILGMRSSGAILLVDC